MEVEVQVQVEVQVEVLVRVWWRSAGTHQLVDHPDELLVVHVSIPVSISLLDHFLGEEEEEVVEEMEEEEEEEEEKD